MLIVSPSTANALAPYASERAFVMFVQVNPPKGGMGPILIEGVKGAALGRRLGQLARDNAFDPMLIGLLETTQPEQTAYQVKQDHDADRLHDDWFEPTARLLGLVQQAQLVLQELLAQTHPGAMETAPVDIDAIATMLGVSIKTVRRLVDKNQIPFLRVGSQLRFVPADVMASLQQTRR